MRQCITLLIGTEDCSESHGGNYTIGAIPPELSNNQLDFFDNLTGGPMLCEVVRKCSRAERVAALRARGVGQYYSALHWLFSPPRVSTTGQYATDPNTGECKTQ